MAKILALNDIVELRVGASQTNQAAFNVTHWRVSAFTGGSALDVAFATAMEALLAPPYKAAMTTIAKFEGVRAQVVWPRPLPVAVISKALTGLGTAGANAMPAQVSGLITLRTNMAGPGGRGRLYIPFPDMSGNDGVTNAPDLAVYIPLLDNIGAAIATPLTVGVLGNTATLEPGLWNRTTHVFTPLTNVTSVHLWATQRRRGDEGRPNLVPPW